MGSSIMKAPRLPVQWEVMVEPLGADTEGHAARIREHAFTRQPHRGHRWPCCMSTSEIDLGRFSPKPLSPCSDSEGAGGTCEEGKKAEE